MSVQDFISRILDKFFQVEVEIFCGMAMLGKFIDNINIYLMAQQEKNMKLNKELT